MAFLAVWAMLKQLATSYMWAALTVVGIAAGAYYLQLATRTVEVSWPKEKQPQPYTRRVQPKKRKYQRAMNSLDDFVPLNNMEPVVDVVQFFTRRGNEFCVYSIDWEQESAVLVRPVDGADLKDHPFFREAQRRTAAEILSIPFSNLQDVTDAIGPKVAHVQNGFIYMTGRCGSTLLTRAIEATSVAQAVCEPEVFTIINMAVTQARRARQNTGFDEDNMVQLLRNVVTLLNYHLLMADPRHRDVVIYKLKPDVILIGDLMYRAFPSAKNVFIYRDGMGYLESFAKLYFRKKIVHFLMRSRLSVSMIPDYVRVFGDDTKFADQSRGYGSFLFYLTTMWVGAMQRALELQRLHPEYFFHCLVYYDALVKGKEKSIRLLLKSLGVKWDVEEHGEEAEKMREVFDRDSQAGTCASARTKMAGEKWTEPAPNWLGDRERDYMSAVCRATGNDILGPDFIFPDTML
ncbi:PREDICTED: uncharacterized protein LOC109476590 [Branchiostoma belcheri]|uniref:Uncharacterized protein LOC109476590 n=1 Tax=Branchiostoma belcheri TaxID=7741 RepID=A0A6P4ZQ99_BRABE|nr:PREDICTED: uncharacterized protein LOC109476590 [Branchiostoma belcheri]